MDVGIGCRVHPNPNPCAPSLGGVFGGIIGYPVLNMVYGPNNPLGNECHSEIVGDVLILGLYYRNPTLYWGLFGHHFKIITDKLFSIVL